MRVIHRLNLKNKEEENGKPNVKFTGVGEFGAASVAALQRGIWGWWSKGKLRREDRAKLSTELDRVRASRQNTPPRVIGASHGYRSEQSTGRLQGNFIPQMDRPGYS